MIVFSTNRTALTISGAVSALLGFAALVWPGITAQILAVIVGVFLLVESLIGLLAGKRSGFVIWSAALQGLVGLAIALFLIVLPGTALRVIVLVIAVWLALRGLIQAVIAVQNRRVPGAAMFLGMIAAISLLVGALLIFRPEAGIIAFSWLLGIYAIVSGAISMLWAQRARRVTADTATDRSADTGQEPPADPPADHDAEQAAADDGKTEPETEGGESADEPR